MQKNIFVLLLFFLSSTIIFAQKKALDHSVYDGWKSLTNVNISNDGKILTSLISPQEGDTTLWIRNLDRSRTFTMDRVNRYSVSIDGRFTVGLLRPSFADRRQARIDRKRPEDMPKDSLVIVNNTTFSIDTIPNVKSFTAPAEWISHIAYQIDAPKDTTRASGATREKDLLIIRNILTQNEDTIRNTKSVVFNRFGNSLATVIEPDKKDSTDTPGVLFLDLTKNMNKRIANEDREYIALAFDERGEQLVFLTSNDSSKVEQKAFDVRYFRIGADSAMVIADKNIRGLPEGWIFNEFSTAIFSRNGERILVGSAPKLSPKDTTIVDFEMARLDIWHWQDPLLQSQQLVELQRERRRTFTGVIDPRNPNLYIPLANQEIPNVVISDENNGRFALLISNLPYLIQSQWDISPTFDAWTYDFETNNIQSIGTAINGRLMLSPQGNYTFWFSGQAGHWFAFDNRTRTTVNLTQNINVNFWDETNDQPFEPSAYGFGGWTENDEFVLLYDAFDIWKIDPKGTTTPVNITLGQGRKDSLVFRYINTDSEKRFITSRDQLLLSAFDRRTKEHGYFTLNQSGRNPLQKRILDGYTFSLLNKARDANVYAFAKANFNTSPDLHVTKNLWRTDEKLTDINPQMHDYNWGTAELVEWTSFSGVPLQGILYKPEDFDPNKKYPVMIYFYDRHSDNLFNYFAPAPSRSIINIPFYVSRGYIVFTPDILYTVGRPGNDAYNSVVSGAQMLAKKPWVDETKMGIQGQSWGGYQVAYLITRTDMFAAAGSGAPVSNMTSAYGQIRWESGRSRQFQYEQTQSRIGATMSDSLDLYIENSPVFFVDRVNTPLLIMHNDNDGAVPWYQGIELFVSLRRFNKPVWMLQYNNEAHNLVHRRNTKDLVVRWQQFFDHYLKGDPAPVWMTRGIPALEKGINWGFEIEE
ncbi:MAG: prolyl oligopeptidase family serine peptidase [Dysgonamonadaceae bacterium]|jgi:dipeptidyl aminopeptidase/acylaminoacyl peptidase|nr:prolyl oligopeptidase family serine peptidase [Dysgonamonadaceae bacterium]